MIKKECKQCGKQFVISDKEISFYKSKNLSLPKRCKECRKSNKKNKPVQKTENIDNRLEDIVNSITSSPVMESAVGISEKTKTGSKKLFLLPAVFVLAMTVAAALFFSCGDTDVNDTVTENVQNAVTGMQTGSGHTQSSELIITSASDAESDIAFTEVPGGNEYDDSSAFVFQFRNDKFLEDHFQKHGKEMGFKSADEYEEAAQSVINSDDALHKTEAEDGDDIYYIEDTNDFVVVSTDGYIRTYFRPDNGKKYYDNQ